MHDSSYSVISIQIRNSHLSIILIDDVLNSFTLNRKTVEEIDILSRIPPLKKCNNKWIILVNLTHEGSNTKPNILKKHMVLITEKWVSLNKNGRISIPSVKYISNLKYFNVLHLKIKRKKILT